MILVGAGPGDPGLITLRGAECLRVADVVLYDYLASPQLLSGTRSSAELVCLGRHGQGRIWSQVAINDALVRHARAGKLVVRLKGGDPLIFARAAEEIAALETAGVPYEIVPGITAAQGAGSHAGIPLTHRDDASCVAFVTGHECGDKRPADELDYAALATFPGTLIYYMGITTAPKWSRELISHGKSPTTPAAIIRRCTFSDQQTTYTTLGELTDVVETMKLRPPAIVIVGDVARKREVVNWFTSRPLFGQTVLVTRPAHQAAELAGKLRELGANVLYQPAIEISEPRDWSAVDAVVRRLAEFDWLVFSSANGVEYFIRRLLTLGFDLRQLGCTKVAAIGPATVMALAKFHLNADVQPDEYRAEALAEAIAPHAHGKRIFLARASRGREVLAEQLSAAGAQVEQAVVYESRDIRVPNDDVLEALATGHVEWGTVTSSAIARSLVAMFGETLRKTRLVAISPLTAEVLTELGYPPAAVAETYTSVGIISAILSAGTRKP
ncbi:MAG: uroporphyrinogen-III C-methyltransferase [Pirellulales bacterium]